MSTIYKIELVSHWINYNPKDLEEKIKEVLKDKKNEIEIKVIREK